MLKNISHNNQKKIALINDFTGFGRCSIAVELPIISTLKVQCCPLPTSIFSNHTGFDSYFFDDYTDRMERYVEEWKKLDLSFNGICSGFLGSARQISIVKDFIKEFKTDDTIVVVDPVMGDYGKIYSTYTDEMCGLMKELVAGADIITIHYESEKHLDRTIEYIKAKGKKAAVALNPATPVHLLKNIIANLDMVLIMTVNPGFGGQKFIEYTIDKVKEVKEMSIKYNENLMIQVDGGIDSSNVQKVIDAGANVIVAGSAVFKNDVIEENIKALRGI